MNYEFNLAFQDGSRRKVVSHGNRSGLFADAFALGAFLGKTVWDGTGGR